MIGDSAIVLFTDGDITNKGQEFRGTKDKGTFDAQNCEP